MHLISTNYKYSIFGTIYAEYKKLAAICANRHKMGNNRAIHCVRDEQLYDYVVENKKNSKVQLSELIFSKKKGGEVRGT